MWLMSTFALKNTISRHAAAKTGVSQINESETFVKVNHRDWTERGLDLDDVSGKTLYLSFSGAFLICAVLSLTKYFGINTAQSLKIQHMDPVRLDGKTVLQFRHTSHVKEKFQSPVTLQWYPFVKAVAISGPWKSTASLIQTSVWSFCFVQMGWV